MGTKVKIREIKAIIRKTKETHELRLNRRNLTKIPEEFLSLTNLKKLDLSSNRITNIPESISNLSNLTELNLSSNQLENIPETILNLPELTNLYLSSNEITNIPEFITKLPKLRKLNLSSNKLIDIPVYISNLSELAWLNLNSNQIEKLPTSMSELINLDNLLIKNNPITNPPLEILNKGTSAIQEYLRQLEEEGEDYLYEAKLIIVGEAGAGKTSLAKKIQNPDYQLQPQEKSTEGIDVNKWSFNFDKNKEFNVNIWDFGGQEIYHATHEFFLTKRSLYILVIDNRKEDDNLEYWLNLIEIFSDNSPVIIIKNQKQDRIRDIKEKTLRGKFNSLKETLAINLETSKDIDKIIRTIKYYIRNLDHVGNTLPKTWIKVRKALESDSRDYINFKEYCDICEKNGFNKSQDQLQLSGYLHDLGICLHFQEDKTSLLYETLILKPEWGTEAVYKVLDNREIIKNKGAFSYSNLENIWSDRKYTSMQSRLLELMTKFQLCYEIPQNKYKYIAPQLLDLEASEYDWEDKNNLILCYEYPDFMPKGIITKFIVVMYQLIEELAEQTHNVWRSGVVLKEDDTKVEVVEDYDKREIRIRVVGKLKRYFMTKVVCQLDRINDTFPGLKYQQKIPCNCRVCENSQKPHAYQFKNLLERLDNKRLSVECYYPPYEPVPILSLIDNVIDTNQLEDENKKQPTNQTNNLYIQYNIQKNKQKTSIKEGNYNENIAGNFHQEIENENQVLTEDQIPLNLEENEQMIQHQSNEEDVEKFTSEQENIDEYNKESYIEESREEYQKYVQKNPESVSKKILNILLVVILTFLVSGPIQNLLNLVFSNPIQELIKETEDK